VTSTEPGAATGPGAAAPGVPSGGGPHPDREWLLPAEIQALVGAYRNSVQADLLLRSAGYPSWAVPAGAVTMGEYWAQVSAQLEAGVMAGGRVRILSAAATTYRFQPVFAAAAGPPQASSESPDRRDGGGADRPSERLRVMLLGAEPARLGATRAGAELREVLREAGDRLDVRAYAAATAAELDTIRTELPHVLHLACHGEEDAFVLEDESGEAHRLAAVDLAETLKLAAEHRGHRLRAMVLRSCGSERVAARFSPYADVVVAHQGDLSGECSVLFASLFYRELAACSHPPTATGIRAAARFAAQDTVNRADMCRTVKTGLIILPETV